MKISKLFHWLYGAVMLLPLLAIGVTCGYAMFNKNAYQSYGDKYVDNLTQVNNANLLIENSFYKVIYNENYTSAGNQVYKVNSTTLNEYVTLQNDEYITTIYFLNDNGVPRLNYTLNSGTTSRIMNWQNVCPTFTFNLNEQVGTVYFNTVFTSIYLINEVEREISDVFYYSVDKVIQSDLFSWAYDSFLVAPFSYIVGLFSMPTNSPVVMLMSYWLAISIIWLVFDLVMYVPLLVHRWLDKGVLE